MFLALAALPLTLFAVLVHRRVRTAYVLLPVAAVAWALVHASGVHATVAGVLLAFTVPVRRRDGRTDEAGLAEVLEHRVRPLSAGLAVPVFAFFASGVAVGGVDGLGDSLRDPVALGVALGLLVGKTVGVFGSTWLLATFTGAELDDDLAWVDVLGLAMLAGVGFTVSLLIGELAFGGTPQGEHVVVGVLVGSTLAAALASLLLRLRNRVYRRMSEADREDLDGDGVPDAYQ